MKQILWVFIKSVLYGPQNFMTESEEADERPCVRKIGLHPDGPGSTEDLKRGSGTCSELEMLFTLSSAPCGALMVGWLGF